MEKTIQNLLSQVNLIRKKHEEIAKITGENYNVFQILGLSTNEVKTHSAFIANLLDPQGSHNQNDKFLIEFLKLAMNELSNNFNTQECIVEVEKHIGYINNISYDEGGRIDIVITDKIGNRIIIENKIYASDLYKQLKRYHSFDATAHLIYLTLNGDSPSKESVEGLDTETISRIECISYENFIIEWLIRCKSIAVNHPLLRETITQYINLIKVLTNKSLSTTMSNDIKKTITNTLENFIAASDVANEMSTLINTINLDILKRIKVKLENTFSVDADKKLSNNNAYFFNFFEYKNEFKFYLRIGLEQGMSIWLAPYKTDKPLGVANDEQIESFKKLLFGLAGLQANQNYTGWIISKNNFINYSISDKYKLVNENSSEIIVNAIVSEIIDFLNFFKDNAKKSNIELSYNLI